MRRNKLSRKIMDMAEFAFIMAFLGLLKPFPLQFIAKTAGSLGALIVSKFKSPRTRIENNLDVILPDLSVKEKQAIIRGVGRTFGMTMSEILNSRKLFKKQAHFHASGPGLQVIKEAAKNGKGAIIVSGHYGQMDVPRHYLKAQGINVAVIYRAYNNPHYDKMILKHMNFAGSPVFPKGRRGSIKMYRYIKNGGIVAVLLDQKYKKGETLDFMGQDATTSTAIAEIALKNGVPFVPVYATRRDFSQDIDLEFQTPIEPSDAITMTQAANDSLAAKIREHPEQWLWLHKRWVFSNKR